MMGLSLPHFFLWRDRPAPPNVAPTSTPARAASGIGQERDHDLPAGRAAHIDIWDPKPDAPANIRGEFKPIKTKIPGT